MSFRVAPAHEDGYQNAIEDVLKRHGFEYEREVRLHSVFSDTDRIDFLVTPGIGLEVKTKGSFAKVTRQLLRYAMSPDIRVLVLATTRCQLASVPKMLLEKPVVTAVSFGAMF
jgi:hypothetical protein